MLPALTKRRMSFPMWPTPPALRHELDDLFDRFFGNEETTGLMRGWFTPVSMWEDDGHVFVEMEIPGVDQEHLDVVVHQGNLRITGERRVPEEDRDYRHNERVYGRFERVIALPDAVDPDSIEAEMHSGILSLKFSKKPEAQPKKVAIRSS